MTISQPQNLLAKPFANDGNYQIIPEADAGHGRASLSAGFPTETQRPLAQGGIAPNRLDFNGILHMLSAAMFWQQSGGQWTYLPTLNYATPCIVYHQNELWWCVKENGPDTTVVAPGTNESYWMNFLNFVAGGKSTIGNPVGTIIAYYGTTAPDGYFACNGSTFSATTYPELRALLGTSILPDLRGEFLRGEGTLYGYVKGVFAQAHSGVFQDGQGGWSNLSSGTNISGGATQVTFRASKVARTATETRPHNMAVLFCIKHD